MYTKVPLFLIVVVVNSHFWASVLSERCQDKVASSSQTQSYLFAASRPQPWEDSVMIIPKLAPTHGLCASGNVAEVHINQAHSVGSRKLRVESRHLQRLLAKTDHWHLKNAQINPELISGSSIAFASNVKLGDQGWYSTPCWRRMTCRVRRIQTCSQVREIFFPTSYCKAIIGFWKTWSYVASCGHANFNCSQPGVPIEPNSDIAGIVVLLRYDFETRTPAKLYRSYAHSSWAQRTKLFWIRVLDRLILGFSDQQLVTGLSILLIGLIRICRISTYHFYVSIIWRYLPAAAIWHQHQY